MEAFVSSAGFCICGPPAVVSSPNRLNFSLNWCKALSLLGMPAFIFASSMSRLSRLSAISSSVGAGLFLTTAYGCLLTADCISCSYGLSTFGSSFSLVTSFRTSSRVVLIVVSILFFATTLWCLCRLFR